MSLPIILLLLMSYSASASVAQSLPVVVKAFSLHKEKEEKQIKNYVPLPTVLWGIIFSYRDAESTTWMETNNIKDNSWFFAPCYCSLTYLSSDRIAAGSNNGDIELFDPAAKKRIGILSGKEAIESIAHNKEQGEIIGGGRRGGLIIWNNSSYKCLQMIKAAHKYSIEHLSLIKPNFLVSATEYKGEMSFWNMKDRRRVATLATNAEKMPGFVALNSDSFVTVQDDKVVLWDVERQQQWQESMKIDGQELRQATSFNPNVIAGLADYAITWRGNKPSGVLLCDVRSMEFLEKYVQHPVRAHWKTLIAHHGLLIVRALGMIEIHDVRRPTKPLQSISILGEEGNYAINLASDPDSSAFAASIYPSAIKTWDSIRKS